MKGLDTPVLLDLLRGRPGAQGLMEAVGGEELATTEVNLFELEWIARAGPPRGRETRLAALENLRRKLTVLPIDSRATRAAAQLASNATAAVGASALLMLGAAETAGCTEWITHRGGAWPKPRGKLAIRQVAMRTTKK